MEPSPDSELFSTLDENLWPVLEQLARALHVKSAELQPTLDAITATAVDTIEPARHAGVILVVKGQLTPVATLGDPPRVLDEFQRKLGRGPCFDAAKTQHPVLIQDTGVEPRWPTLVELARSLDVASMLCVPLRADDQRLGALSMYSEVPNAFTAHHVQLTSLFATHAALALADAQRIENLTIALNNRDVIGQAKGILIERLHLTPQAAFEQLAQASQALNQKLSVVAQNLVETGELPAPMTKV